MAYSQDRQREQPATQPAAEFDAYRDTYSNAVNEAVAFSGLNVDFFTRVKADYLLDLIAEVAPDVGQARVLDVGCGVGNFHPLLIKKVGGLAGVDVSAACLARARDSNAGVDYHHFDGARLPFENHAFHVAFAVCVFHHIAVDQRAALVQDIRRVLKPNGLFVIFEHNPRNPLTMRVVNRCPFDKDAILLRPAEAEQLLAAAGFRDTVSRHILTVPAAGKVLRGIDRLAGRLPLGAQYYTRGQA